MRAIRGVCLAKTNRNEVEIFQKYFEPHESGLVACRLRRALLGLGPVCGCRGGPCSNTRMLASVRDSYRGSIAFNVGFAFSIDIEWGCATVCWMTSRGEDSRHGIRYTCDMRERWIIVS